MGNGRGKTKIIQSLQRYKFQESSITELLEQRRLMDESNYVFEHMDDTSEYDEVEDQIRSYFQKNVTPETIDKGLVIKMLGDNDNELYLTKSSRKGVLYQMTYVDDKGPYSHTDFNSMGDVIEELVREGGEIISGGK